MLTLSAMAAEYMPDIKKSEVIVFINGKKYYVHTVKSGDTLYSIAKAYGVEEAIITQNNPTAADGLKIDQSIKIPVSEKALQEARNEKKRKKDFVTHKIKAGQTLYSIARDYNISVSAIREDNPAINPQSLTIGETLWIRRKNGTNKGNTVSTTDPSKNWHVYSMEWDAEQVSFFLDGNLVFQFKNEHRSYKEWPYDKRFHLLLNIAVGGSWGGEQGIDNGIFPQRMLVDYVRVYQYGEVEEEPVDGVLKLNSSIAATNVCEEDSTVLTIDTTGTGNILYPSKLNLTVLEFNDKEITDVTSELQKSDKGFILKRQQNVPGFVKYITRFSYREGESEFEQIVHDTAYVIVSAPSMIDLDKIEICEGDRVTIDLSESEIKDYEWKSEESGDILSNNAILDFEPKETTNISFKANDGICTTSASIEIKVNPRPVIASVDSIGPRDVMVVLENYDYAPYLYALDRGPYGEKDEYHNLDARDYVVSVKDANGCIAQYRFTIKEPTAVELIAGDNISVYSNGNNVIVTGVEAGASFSVIDAIGSRVIEGVLSVDGEINASSLNDGIYYVVIEGKAYPFIKK